MKFSIQKLLEKLQNRPFLKNTILLVGGTAAAQVISVLVTPVLSRIYLPEHFGVLTVFVSILSIIIPVVTLRYAVAIPLAENEEQADHVIWLSILISFLLSILFAIVLFLFGPKINQHYQEVDIGPFLWLLPFSLLGAGLYETFTGWSLRGKRIKLISQTRLTQGISSAITNISLGLLGVRPLGLLLGHFMSKAAGSGRMLVPFFREKGTAFWKLSWDGILSSAKRFKRFPLFQSWSKLLLSLGAQLPALFIASSFGLEIAGFFGMASNMLNLPMHIIGQSVAQVYFSEIAQYGRTNPKKILDLTISIFKKLIMAAIIPVVIIFIASPWGFGYFLGEEWRQAGVYAQYLSVMLFFRFISAPLVESLNVLEKQQIHFILTGFRLLLVCAIFLFSNFSNFNILDTLLVYSLALSIIYYPTITIIVFLTIQAEVKKSRNQAQ
jgi:O-antigen/teichoic acid export membrane protein